VVQGLVWLTPYDLGQRQNWGVKIVRTHIQGDQGALREVIGRLKTYPATADIKARLLIGSWSNFS
jgi:hypothetical protein